MNDIIYCITCIHECMNEIIYYIAWFLMCLIGTLTSQYISNKWKYIFGFIWGVLTTSLCFFLSVAWTIINAK